LLLVVAKNVCYIFEKVLLITLLGEMNHCQVIHNVRYSKKNYSTYFLVTASGIYGMYVHTYVCMYVCIMYICMYVHAYVHMYVCMYVCVSCLVFNEIFFYSNHMVFNGIFFYSNQLILKGNLECM